MENNRLFTDEELMNFIEDWYNTCELWLVEQGGMTSWEDVKALEEIEGILGGEE